MWKQRAGERGGRLAKDLSRDSYSVCVCVRVVFGGDFDKVSSVVRVSIFISIISPHSKTTGSDSNTRWKIKSSPFIISFILFSLTQPKCGFFISTSGAKPESDRTEKEEKKVPCIFENGNRTFLTYDYSFPMRERALHRLSKRKTIRIWLRKHIPWNMASIVIRDQN